MQTQCSTRKCINVNENNKEDIMINLIEANNGM